MSHLALTFVSGAQNFYVKVYLLVRYLVFGLLLALKLLDDFFIFINCQKSNRAKHYVLNSKCKTVWSIHKLFNPIAQTAAGSISMVSTCIHDCLKNLFIH